MTTRATTHQSVSRLRAEVLTAHLLVWMVTAGRDVELTPGAHLYFCGCYQRLADWHRKRGHERRARELQAKADEHYRDSGGDGPPYAAALAMPRPLRWVSTEAVAAGPPPDEAA